MAASKRSEEMLVAKIRSLPPEKMAEVEDFVDFVSQRAQSPPSTPSRTEPLDFPVDHLGTWPEELTLRREDTYGDDGR